MASQVVGLDTPGSVMTAGMSVIHCLLVNQRPVPWSSILQFAVGYSLCPATQRLLGPRRYARVRQVPVTVARLLTMSGSLGVQIGLGPLPLDRFWTGFLWRLLLATLCITQLWITLAYQLPLRAHVVATLLCAADYLGRGLPAQCALPGGPPQPPGSEAWLLFPQARGSFRSLASALDWPFWYFLGGRQGRRLEDSVHVSDAALCCAVTAWVHLAFGVIASTAMAYVLAWDKEQGVGSPRRPRLLPRWGVASLLPRVAVVGPVLAAVVGGVYASTMAWAVLRVLTIRLL